MGATKEIIRTLTAKCKGCYRCVRACPVKAVGIKDNQSFVDASRCILCGNCIRECPQNARVYRNDIDVAADLLASGRVVASVAPSFSSIYSGWKANCFPSALRQLGFFKVTETAEGAAVIAGQMEKTYRDPLQGATISAVCPTVVNYVEKYSPGHLDKLFPFASPMVAHARILKKHFGEDIKVVIIGPCVAKKFEAQRPEFEGDVDLVLTFNEVNEWLEKEGISLDNCPESGFDNFYPLGKAKLFSIPGGMLKTMGIAQIDNDAQIVQASGLDQVKMLFDDPQTLNGLELMELLACPGGCINGVGIESEENVFQRRANVINYAARKPVLPEKKKAQAPNIELRTVFKSQANREEEITEEQISEVFLQMDKKDPESLLDCGACGYPNCRDKAKAVLLGLTEIENCVPYMRKLAQQRRDKIVESSPDGIVILDGALNILSMNASFCQYFSCDNSLLGKNISYLLDAQNFEKVATGAETQTATIISCYGREFHEVVYRLPEENQYVGIYTDISGQLLTEAKIERLKTETVEKARELMEHQIQVAQTMAKFLGENTARSEELVERLMSIYEG